jgi:hypothetical protein
MTPNVGTDGTVNSGEAMWQTLRDWGYIPTPESRARGRKRLDDARARVTPESLAESTRLLDDARRQASEGLA